MQAHLDPMSGATVLGPLSSIPDSVAHEIITGRSPR